MRNLSAAAIYQYKRSYVNVLTTISSSLIYHTNDSYKRGLMRDGLWDLYECIYFIHRYTRLHICVYNIKFSEFNPFSVCKDNPHHPCMPNPGRHHHLNVLIFVVVVINQTVRLSHRLIPSTHTFSFNFCFSCAAHGQGFIFYMLNILST